MFIVLSIAKTIFKFTSGLKYFYFCKPDLKTDGLEILLFPLIAF